MAVEPEISKDELMLTKTIQWSAVAALIGVALSRSLPGAGLALPFAVVATPFAALLFFFSLELVKPVPTLAKVRILDRSFGSESR